MNNINNNLIKIEVTHLSLFSLAYSNNSLSLIKELKIIGLSDEPSEYLLEIKTLPEYTNIISLDIKTNGKVFILDKEFLSLKVIPDLIKNTSSKETITLKVTLFKETKLIAELKKEICFLPYQVYPGIKNYPEVLLSFINPHNPSVLSTYKSVILLGESIYKKLSFKGYSKKDPNDIVKQVYSLYSAVQKLNISLLNSAFDFNSPTEITFPDEIIHNKQAKNLDLALFLASLLEAMHLNPLIILSKTKVLCGVFTTERSFQETIQDDFSLLYKFAQKDIKEIILIDPASLMNQLDFEESENNALDHLKNDDLALFFLDVFRGRRAGFKPLPLRIKTKTGYVIENSEEYAERLSKLPLEIAPIEKLSLEKNISKYQKWERKLLDLTLANSLLNMQVNSKTLQIMLSDLETFYNEFLKGYSFKVLSVVNEFKKDDYAEKIVEKIKEPAIGKILASEIANKRFRTFLDENKTNTTLESINRQYKLSLEENGYNNLFLALGSLKWYETKTSNTPIYSPLVLLPVELKEIYKESYSLKVTDEGPAFNITLVELLNKNYNINLNFIEELIKRKEVNLQEIFTLIRQSLVNLRDFTVEDTLFLGIFSFNKFMMYNDLKHRKKEIESNKIVKALLNNSFYQDSSVKKINPEEIDLAKYCIPIAADSSQLEAVINAHENKSFVLHGPPGTGKSQTITNIIANALYHNKTVLFIAEKQAALNVVDARLNALGLSDHTLKLHSHKANKRDILTQFENVLNTNRFSIDEDFKKTLDEFNKIKDDINLYVNNLHKKNHLGISFFEAYTNYDNIEGPNIYFDQKFYQQLTAQNFLKLKDLIAEIVIIDKRISLSNSHFSDINSENLSYEQSERLKSLLTQNQDAGNYIQNKLKELEEKYQLNINFNKLNVLEDFRDLLKALHQIDLGYYKYVSSKDFELILSKLEAISSLQEESQKIQDNINKKTHTPFFPEGGALLREMLLKLSEKNGLAHFFLKRKIKKTIIRFLLTKDKKQIPFILDSFAKDEALQNDLDNLYLEIEAFFPKEAQKNSDAFVEFSYRLKNLNEKTSNNFRMNIIPFLVKNIKSELYKLNNSFTAFFQTLSSICDILKINYKFTNALFPDCINAKISSYIEYFPDLEYYSLYLSYKKLFVKNGFKKLVEDFEKGLLKSELLASAFLKSFYHVNMEMLISANPYLYNFKGTLFDHSIQKYKKLFESYQEYTKLELKKRLNEKIPYKGFSGIFNEELSILLKAIKSNSRGLSIRQLFEQTKNIITSLTPCMLMSPSSLAQYINFDFKKFDLVIFDEASQLPTPEAVGAISRGENAIIVGDPKQLPPTTFFSATISDNDFESEDLESILDDLIAINMPEKHLLWHYRSRHESLIAFSNHSFYKNSLLTMPSNDYGLNKISFIKVNGIYERGSTKINKEEAVAVIKEIERRLFDPILVKESIGVVTFNSYQANYIDDLLKRALSKNPKLKEIHNNLSEQIIIKNLENIQGDERDCIMFSVGYGFDRNKKMSLNFGPLNKEGGWRRLNVACTRSRTEMLIFSSIEPEDLKTTETTASGVEALKNFLEFAKNPENYFKFLPTNAQTIATNYITKRLKASGYNCDINLGSSLYKIDIAVKNSDKKSYSLAILLDGLNYLNIPTTYERNISSKERLKNLGWNVKTVWLIDFFKNPNAEYQKIEQILKSNSEPKVIVPDLKTNELKITEIKPKELKIYINASPVLEKKFTKASEFCDPLNTKIICETINAILEVESPVSKTLLIKKVAGFYGVSHKALTVEKFITMMLVKLRIKTTSTFNQIFFWRKNHDQQKYDEFRINFKGNPYPRTLFEIEPLEIRNGMREVIRLTKEVKKSKLLSGIAEIFQIAYNEETDFIFVDNALDILAQDDEIEITDDLVRLKA